MPPGSGSDGEATVRRRGKVAQSRQHTVISVEQRKVATPVHTASEPEDATAETRRIFGDGVLATSGSGGGRGGASHKWLAPPQSERGVLAMFCSPAHALEELRCIKEQFQALRQLGYKIQGMTPSQLSAEWDELRTAGNRQYAELEAAIRKFVRHSNGAVRWRPRFYTYYVLPIVLHLVKLAVFCSAAGILGVLLYDVLVIVGFTLLRHPCERLRISS
jgi:hypothetical protein